MNKTYNLNGNTVEFDLPENAKVERDPKFPQTWGDYLFPKFIITTTEPVNKEDNGA